MNKETRQLINYALPAIGENVLQTTVGFVDGLLIAKLSLIAVSAVSLVNGVLAIYQAVFIALAVGVATVVSNAHGAKNKGDVSKAVQSSFFLTLVIGILISLLSLVFSQPILSLMGAKGDVLQQGKVFFKIVAGTSILIILMTILGQLIRTAGHPSIPLRVNIIVNILNFVFDSILIFGLFGFPKLGILGAGIGTVVARLIGVCLLLYQLQKTSHALDSTCFRWQPKIWQSEIVKRAIPIMGERLLMRLGDVIIFIFLIGYGEKVFAGNAIGETITAYNYLPAFGFATGASILVAQAFGAQNTTAIRSLTKTSFLITAVISTVLAGIIFLFSPYILEFFTSDNAAISAAHVVILISFASEPIVAGVIIYTATLQAMGDAKTPFYSTMFGMWGVRLGFAWGLGTVLGLGIWGVWLATVLDNIFRLIVLKLVYERRIKNKKLNRAT